MNLIMSKNKTRKLVKILATDGIFHGILQYFVFAEAKG